MPLALSFFGMSGNPYKAIEVFRPIMKNCKKTDKLEDLMSYAYFLKDLDMGEATREIIWMLGSVFQEERDRVKLGNFLIDMKKNPPKINDSYLNSFMKKEVKSISENDVETINTIIEELKAKDK